MLIWIVSQDAKVHTATDLHLVAVTLMMLIRCIPWITQTLLAAIFAKDSHPIPINRWERTPRPFWNNPIWMLNLQLFQSLFTHVHFGVFAGGVHVRTNKRHSVHGHLDAPAISFPATCEMKLGQKHCLYRQYTEIVKYF
ncbi:hypothetical protein BJX66DRAFT_295131 [Aspergillus keveii]|uniref:Secreted protein n=1 Tax=Aspergillus keveii TaxID=714993 RepID=A0ABR4GIX4_9EURO